MTTVLDEPFFPIIGWYGPSEDMVRPEIMRDMVEAGFTVSCTSPLPGKHLEALDIAHDAGIRLIMGLPEYYVDDTFELTSEKQQAIAKVVAEIKDHPALYAYALRDEPMSDQFERLGSVVECLRELDPYHISYINHFPALSQEGWFTGSIEWFWHDYVRICKPSLLSYDFYTITVVPCEELEQAYPADPSYFPEEQIRVKPGYFEALELLRRLSIQYDLPFWAFTNATRHYAYPPATEGHLRFQLMHNLAYGARGVQYFTYAAPYFSYAVIDHKGRRSPIWETVRRINEGIHGWASTLRQLRSLAVYHTGPIWSGTTVLPPPWGAGPWAVICTGDPVTIGVFDNPQGDRYLLLVNKNPCTCARIRLNTKAKSALWEVSPIDGSLHRIWRGDDAPPPWDDYHVMFTPGEGRLLKVMPEGTKR